MKLIDLTCNKCGAQLKVNAELSKCMCQYCGNEMLIDQEVIHHKIDNAFDAGYQAELGRMKAQEDKKAREDALFLKCIGIPIISVLALGTFIFLLYLLTGLL